MARSAENVRIRARGPARWPDTTTQTNIRDLRGRMQTSKTRQMLYLQTGFREQTGVNQRNQRISEGDVWLPGMDSNHEETSASGTTKFRNARIWSKATSIRRAGM